MDKDVSPEIRLLISVDNPDDKDVSPEIRLLISVDNPDDKDVSPEIRLLITLDNPDDKDVSPETLLVVSSERDVLMSKIKEGSLDKAAASSDNVSNAEGVVEPIKF